MQVTDALYSIVILLFESFGSATIIGSIVVLAFTLTVCGVIYYETKGGPLVNGKLYVLYMILCFTTAIGWTFWVIVSVMKSDVNAALAFSILSLVLIFLGRAFYYMMKDGPKSAFKRESNRDYYERVRTGQADDDDQWLKENSPRHE